MGNGRARMACPLGSNVDAEVVANNEVVMFDDVLVIEAIVGRMEGSSTPFYLKGCILASVESQQNLLGRMINRRCWRTMGFSFDRQPDLRRQFSVLECVFPQSDAYVYCYVARSSSLVPHGEIFGSRPVAMQRQSILIPPRLRCQKQTTIYGRITTESGVRS